eukprot:TRINITY_DN15200_c0_g1_i1.p1 TRINITY_DN15200_c0_g1~~TRINITY_DN15200_c0_g1_i1.p1  ORF type:complete len:175 (+),score=23.92 TRINITY_DN15200_c0_g1_i1:54-527(+)
MAALQVLKHKRSRDWNEDMIVCPVPVVAADTPIKRTRMRELEDTQMESSTPLYTSPARPSQFPVMEESELETQNLDDYCREKRRTKKETNPAQERLFTYDQVRAIVARVVAEKEAAIRAEYDAILSEKLQEQFRNFQSFNQDYISRQLKDSDFSYLS